ncbi:SagB/ThcOx family dehydrogenase [Candidatus Thorarchaeota archaeon]|nr:MAG: SagB/ThcOx family dehydrogenase [Candidatus Thorarchaeota archaeon]
MKGPPFALPEPNYQSMEQLEKLLKRRRTTRYFSDTPLTSHQISQLMWAAQGTVSHEATGFTHRTSPSAGGKYPLVLYVISHLGVQIYQPIAHTMEKLTSDDIRSALSASALAEVNQRALVTAPITVVVSVDNNTASTISPVWEDVLRYVYLEAGHATQNMALQAQSLGLGLCTITSYRTRLVYESLKMPRHHRPIYLIPVGHPDNRV